MSEVFQLVRGMLTRHRQLIVQMIKREVLGRYRGSVLGLAWSFFNPLLLLIVYTFVFSVVFKAKWGGSAVDQSHGDFAVILFAGLIMNNLFAECLNRAPSLVLSNVTYVKKVVFPLEILVVVAFGSAVFHLLISLAVLFIAQLIFLGHIPWTIVYFPLVLVPLALFSLGISWFLAGLGVYIRDTVQAVSLFTIVLTFVSPIFYPLSAIPERMQVYVKLNPMTFVVEETRKVLIFGKTMDWISWGAYSAVGAVVFIFGMVWFQKVRKGFADVL
ncbi:ABC transporter permease [Achromobacter ruhlandii]|uniref:ABC transporter permease n=1 Tax=Achromobacter ruhlandii TaxID=72557 RepID=UPI0006C41810|nr:ABC transporter permease [Achromobacter ruhlandii]AMG47932.1 ABC transporter permease [Achromobacter xylosoxidans]CUJ29633.1 daunorubicin resistance ABC transporter membrane protein [Achromobacter ruhlandii]CUJ36916.1 daunorubicin resistance ABC transporter membrane protein [Achromobacter ruhlandii]CUK16557.1 daunorubicin resistance ABC transporter membrane protein [Achromobacter ruhlandii]